MSALFGVVRRRRAARALRAATQTRLASLQRIHSAPAEPAQAVSDAWAETRTAA